MNHTRYILTTSRGPLLEEGTFSQPLRARSTARAAIDVYDTEPLPAGHPLRQADHLLATPHIGYVTRGLYEVFYRDTVSKLLKWLDARQAPVPSAPR